MTLLSFFLSNDTKRYKKNYLKQKISTIKISNNVITHAILDSYNNVHFFFILIYVSIPEIKKKNHHNEGLILPDFLTQIYKLHKTLFL